MTTGFPRLKVPRPPINSRPPAGGDKPLGYVKTEPEAVRRPVDHNKPPARYVTPLPQGQTPVRPPSVVSEAKPSTRPKPDFLTRGTREEKAAGERQMGGIGKVTTAPAPPPVRVPAASRQQATLTPADVPWTW